MQATRTQKRRPGLVPRGASCICRALPGADHIPISAGGTSAVWLIVPRLRRFCQALLSGTYSACISRSCQHPLPRFVYNAEKTTQNVSFFRRSPRDKAVCPSLNNSAQSARPPKGEPERRPGISSGATPPAGRRRVSEGARTGTPPRSRAPKAQRRPAPTEAEPGRHPPGPARTAATRTPPRAAGYCTAAFQKKAAQPAQTAATSPRERPPPKERPRARRPTTEPAAASQSQRRPPKGKPEADQPAPGKRAGERGAGSHCTGRRRTAPSGGLGGDSRAAQPL